MILSKKRISLTDISLLKKKLAHCKLNTVCESALCPNIGECFGRGVATVLIMGDVCTRRCTFCGIKKGEVLPLDSGEPERTARLIKELGLRYAVITSVTRDDLPDGGAEHFAETVRELRKYCPDTKVEILVPDFGGNKDSAETVFFSKPDVFSHNIETVPRLYGAARKGADYKRSLELLKWSKAFGLTTKSGIMLGLGETLEEVQRTIKDILKNGCDILTIGQYLAPSKSHYPVKQIYSEIIFDTLKKYALDLGFKSCSSGTYVRSSYMADQML